MDYAKAIEAKKQYTKEEFLTAPLSKLIRLAMDDLRLAETLPNTIIKMDIWHRGGPLEDDGDFSKKKCYVCLAGAAVKNRFDFTHESQWLHGPPEDSRELRRRTGALNYARTGNIWNALRQFNALGEFNADGVFKGLLGEFNVDGVFKGLPATMRVSEYRRNNQKFYRDLSKVADALEAVGY